MRFIIVLFILGLSFQAIAADEDDDFWESRKSSRGSSRSSSSIALGLASNSQLLARSETALTGLFSVTRKGAIQGFFMSPSSDPNTYSIGALYKHVVSGSTKRGFHVGGGLGIGDYADDLSFFHIMANAGFRFTIQKRIQIHVDGGLTITDDDPDDSQTEITGNSAVFGLSLLYIL